MSQARAADLLGCDQTYVSQVERGERLPGRRIANTIQAVTADWPEGPIRSVEWDEWETLQQAESAA